jgi:hypothetical protein
MIHKPILIVDDEKNIRLTLSQVLETLAQKSIQQQTGKKP